MTTHPPENMREVLRELDTGLKALYGKRYRGIVLYGSYARGEAHEGSDVDLLLLLDGPVDKVEEILRIEPLKWPLSLESGYVLSVMPVSYASFQKPQEPFLINARRESAYAP